MVISLLANIGRMFTKHEYLLYVCTQSCHSVSFLALSIWASFRKLGAALGAVSWHKPEENLHGAFQRGDKPGQSVTKLISRLAPVFKKSSSPKNEQRWNWLEAVSVELLLLLLLQTHMYPHAEMWSVQLTHRNSVLHCPPYPRTPLPPAPRSVSLVLQHWEESFETFQSQRWVAMLHLLAEHQPPLAG